MLERTIEYPEIVKIQLSDVVGKLLADITKNESREFEIKYGQPKLLLPKTIEVSIRFDNEIMMVLQPIILEDLIGWVEITFSLERVLQHQKDLIQKSALEGTSIIFLTILLLLLYVRKLIKTIEQYTDFADQLNHVKGKQVNVNTSSIELEHLGLALNSASTNLYEQSIQVSTSMTEMERLAAFPEMNPNIVLSMNKNGGKSRVFHQNKRDRLNNHLYSLC